MDRGCRRREKVRAFYERHPYPPPADSLEDYRALAGPGAAARGLSSRLARAGLPRGSDDPDRRLRDLAGGQARPALARGAGDRHRLQRDQRPSHRGAQAQIRLDNLEVHQLPVERVGELGRPSIRSSAPASSTISRTPRRAGGAARGAARPTARCTSWCTRLTDGPASTCCRSSAGGSASPPPTRDPASSSPRWGRCRPDTRWRRCCARRRTSGTPAALADALLHPQDRAYSVPQLFELLEGAGLTFGRWVWQAPYDPRCGVMARIPQAARLAALPAPSSTPPSSCSAARCFATAWSCTATTATATLAASSASPATPGAATCRFECPTRSRQGAARPARPPC